MSLRDGAWVTPARIRVYSGLLVAMTLMVMGWLGFTAHGVMDAKGRPLGTDFSNIYAAGSYVNAGNFAAPFEPHAQETRERELFGQATPFYGWHYPPFFLVVAGLLAGLPYLWALAVWQGLSGWFYLRSLQHMLPKSGLWLPALAFPAVLINLGHGHNGFLSAGLIGFGVALLRPKPLLAGVCLGLLAYKPQFGLLIPLALMAGGQWRSFAAAALTVLAMTAITLALYGVEVWYAFADSWAFTRTAVLEEGQTGFYKIQSLFAAVRLWGGGVGLAYAFQLGLVLALARTLWRFWRSDAADELKYAALILASFLATPYSLDYDLMTVAPAMALLVRHGLREGFAGYEKSLLAVVFFSPLFVRSVAEYAYMPLTPLLLLLLYWSTLRPSLRDGAHL